MFAIFEWVAMEHMVAVPAHFGAALADMVATTAHLVPSGHLVATAALAHMDAASAYMGETSAQLVAPSALNGAVLAHVDAA